MTETFYEVLGVAEDATTDEIESAYRERLKETHPDVSDDEDAGRETQQLIEARDVLVDEDERERYDRVGHATYVGDEEIPSRSETANAGETDSTTASTAESASTRDRGSRERRARQRVSEEHRRQARSTASASSSSTTASERDGSHGSPSGTASGTARASTSATAASDGRRRPGRHVREDQTDDSGVQYSVRTDVSTSRSYGPVLPSGHRLTLLGIFLALYPVLLFSALLPAFPLPVNLVIGFCLVVTVGYLQSMPRVGLLVFGSWSAVAVFLVVITGIPVLSLVGIAMLGGTLFPFALSILTAWALRF